MKAKNGPFHAKLYSYTLDLSPTQDAIVSTRIMPPCFLGVAKKQPFKKIKKKHHKTPFQAFGLVLSKSPQTCDEKAA